MFGRSKNKTEGSPTATEAAAGAQPVSEPMAPQVTPTASEAKHAAPAVASPSDGTKAPPGQASGQRAGIAIRRSLAFAQIMSVLMRSRQHSRYPIGALRWLVLPPLVTGQFSIGHGQPKPDGAAAPLAVALWASVSPEVDKRLTESLDKPIQLRPSEWRSGDILWLVDAVGSQQALPAFLKQLSETVFKGREVKVRSRGGDGVVTVRTLQALVAG